MISIFHEDLNQQESSEDFAPEDSSSVIGDNVNNPRYSLARDNIQSTSSSEFSFQKYSDDYRKYQTEKEKFFEDADDSEDSDTENSNNEMFNYPSQPQHKSYQREKSNYSDTSKHSQNWGIVECREQIDCITNSCISEILKEIDQVKLLAKNSQGHLDRFIDRVNNLYNQQSEFEKFVSTIKAQFFLIHAQSKLNFGKAIETLQKESLIVKQFFPAYAYRKEILDTIEKNQVVIISSSHIYSLNAALPLILSNIHQDYSLISCEPNVILSHILQEKINFVTSRYASQICILSEKDLLKHCSYTTFFAGNKSCIVINISLKRSVISDIILSYLRDLLAAQKHSKLILLLSPQDNATIFVDYFSSKISTSVLKLPNLILPVKTVWKNAASYPHDDFKDDVVKTIFSIHAVYREPGDIIAFLPNIEDVQLVCEKFELENSYYQYNNVKVICIDDDLSDISMSIMNLRKSSERKVFLLVNNYEALQIPSVRFVIDCGIQKEFYFDSQTDTNVVVPTFISQGRAKMRKYLAGMYNTGICFRLYNKANYLKNMYQKEHAEIFCINPIQSIVMILQHCPQKSKSIQFVETLPSDVLQNTFSTLKAYGAVDENLSLTSLGENIAKLPLPTKYSRLILHGMQSGFGFEAIILVAFFSVKSELFVEAADNQHQRHIDLIKLEFNQLDSDTLTYLNIYKVWKKNGFKKSWCAQHSINYDTLKSVRCKINEIVHLVPQYLDEEVLQQFSEGGDYNYLIEMLFECFHNNLCSYSGHPRIGYRILSTGQYALVHPSSFLLHKNVFPEFVIYEDSTSSDPNFIKHLTHVLFDFIMSHLEKGKLNFNSSDLFDYKLVEKGIDGIGDKVINRFLPKNDKKKIEEVENKVKNDTNARVVLIEPILEKGNVNIYAFSSDIDKCFTSLKNILSGYIQTMTNEEEIKVIEYTHGQNKVSFETKWTKGAETVSAKHIQLTLNPALQDSAACAVESISDFSESSTINYTLKLSWPRLVCTGEGYINFKNQNDFQKARLLAFKNIKVRDYEVFVQVSNLGKNQLLVSEIPSDVTKIDIEKTFSALLPGCTLEVELCYTPPFETTDKDLHNMKTQIEENCVHYSNINKFEVKIVRPMPSSKYMIAYINVFEKRCLNKEAVNLSETKVNNMRLSCEPLYFSELKCGIEVYNALRYCMKEELDIFLEKNKVEYKRYPVNVVPGKDYVTLKISSDDIEVMKLVQMRINHILNGIRLDYTNLKDIHKLFCHGGHMFLKTLGETEKVHIMENYEERSIRLFGPQENCNYVRQYILNFLQNTEDEVTKKINLVGEKQNRLMLKTVISQYGVNLEKFIETCGLRSAALNLKTACLSVYGTKESVEKADECIRELSGTIGFNDTSSDDSSSEEMCPVCFCPPENLSFRLQYCGHLYCSDHLKGLIEQAQFPMQCCAENCSKPITLGDIKYIMNDDVAKINEMADKSLKAYLDSNRDKIYYCPAADCLMFVYKNEVSGNKWNCPLCKNCICVSCNVVYHEGFSCDMYRGSKEDPDYSFKVWQKTTVECKQCPRCQTAIEKTFGCHHMTCRSCGARFCWLCVTEFLTGNDVYNHLGRCRGRQ